MCLGGLEEDLGRCCWVSLERYSGCLGEKIWACNCEVFGRFVEDLLHLGLGDGVE